jgi:hypothetical protein
MKIANPAYDVVFKYLMENNDVAKDIVSAILNEEVISLELEAQEFIQTTATGLRMLKIDFKATIKSKSGELKTILIEIQKSKNGFDIDRFQTYLGINYAKPNIIINEKGESKDERYPITAIYFLGFRLKNVKIPVLKVARQYLNAATNHKLKVKEDFVEKLSHDFYAIQIPRLKMQARTEIEQMLDVFNQNKYKTSDSHVLEYTGNVNDPRIARVVKHLGRAIVSNPDLLHAMIMEDLMEANAERDRLAYEKALQDRASAMLQTAEANEEKKQAIKAKNDAEKAKNDAEKAKNDAEKAKNDAEKAKNDADLENKNLKEELERLKLQLQNRNDTPSV